MAENIDLSGIINTGGGNFTVVSFSSNSKQRYELCFGDTCSMPKCSCNDWGRTGYLYKHFFAIFKKYPAWSLKDLSKLYTESPFLNLDLEVIPIINFDSDDRDRSKIEAPVHMEVDREFLSNAKEEDDFTYIELPCKRKWGANKATLLREHLKEIQNASFLVDDDEVLDEALQKLTELKQLLKKSTPTESNIPLEQQEIKNVPKPNKLLHLSLRKKKDQFSGRHGEKAERFKAAKNIKIAASPNASVEKVEEMWEFLDLPKEQIVFSDTETDENKVLEQHPVKVLPHDELKLVKDNQMLTDASVNLGKTY